jgi:hypothetical protein
VLANTTLDVIDVFAVRVLANTTLDVTDVFAVTVVEVTAFDVNEPVTFNEFLNGI